MTKEISSATQSRVVQQPGSDLSRLFRSVRRHWVVGVCVAAPVLLLTFAYQATLVDEYEATSVISFTPRDGNLAGSELLRLLVSNYVVVAVAPGTLDTISADHPDVDRADLKSAVSATAPASSAVLQISVTTEDGQQAADIANSIATIVLDAVEEDPLLVGSVPQQAVAPDSPSGPGALLYILAGTLVAAFLGILAICIANSVRPTIEELAQLEQHGLAPLAVLQRTHASSATRPADIDFLRARLDLAGARDPDSQVVLAVNEPGARTMVAAELAISFAASGLSVVLVDAGTEPNRLTGMLANGEDRGVSLTQILLGEASLHGGARPTTSQGLDLVDCGDTAGSGAGFRHAERVLAASHSDYAVVVVSMVDRPSSSGRLLAGFAGRILTVVPRGMLIKDLLRADAESSSWGATTAETVAVGFPE